MNLYSPAAVDRLIARIEKRRARLSPDDASRFDALVSARRTRGSLTPEQQVVLRSLVGIIDG